MLFIRKVIWRNILKITVSIPTEGLSYIWASLKWIFNPPRCSACGKRLHSTSCEWKLYANTTLPGWVHPKDLAVQAYASKPGERFCNECVLEELNTKIHRPVDRFDTKHDKCDCCGEERDLYKFFKTDKLRLHFCMQWWNGFYVCKNCIRSVLKFGKVRSSFLKSVNVGKEWRTYHVGAYGLLLKNGKIMLFKVRK